MLLGVALVVLALPLRTVPDDAQRAKAELTAAVEAFSANDVEVAGRHLDAARTQVDAVTDVTDGFGAKVWSWMPVIGSGVNDARLLGSALSELTSAVETAEAVYPKVTGDDATLMEGKSIDLDVLTEVGAALRTVEGHVAAARAGLEDVEGTAPVVGATVAEARDDAMDKVVPVADGLEQLIPLVDQLPATLGKDRPMKYLVAMMNPSELKYAGGSMLTFSVLTVDDGTISRGSTVDVETSPRVFRPVYWEHVEGNPFVSEFSQRITHANLAPSWPVSGEETLRAWEKLRGTEVDGLVAVDVVAISRMMQVTGPVYVEGMGQLRADNVVERTAGDYERFTTAQQAERKALNRALVPAFLDQLFSGKDFLATMRAVGDSADGRHLAFYFRDGATQEAAHDFGLDGSLSDTEHDYTGFFTQNLVGSKADFGQHKDVSSTVTLRADGSAKVTTTAVVENRNDPSVDGELSAYTNPDLDSNLAVFLPRGAKMSKVTVADSEGERAGERPVGDYYGRPFVEEPTVIRAGAEGVLTVTYTVPNAAAVKGTSLTYRLDVDPQASVKAARHEVVVKLPDGFSASSTEAPDGGEWSQTKKGHWKWTQTALEQRTSVSLVASR